MRKHPWLVFFSQLFIAWLIAPLFMIAPVTWPHLALAWTFDTCLYIPFFLCWWHFAAIKRFLRRLPQAHRLGVFAWQQQAAVERKQREALSREKYQRLYGPMVEADLDAVDWSHIRSSAIDPALPDWGRVPRDLPKTYAAYQEQLLDWSETLRDMEHPGPASLKMIEHLIPKRCADGEHKWIESLVVGRPSIRVCRKCYIEEEKEDGC